MGNDELQNESLTNGYDNTVETFDESLQSPETEKEAETEAETAAGKPGKKSSALLLLLLLILVLAVGVSYYINQRKGPAKAVENYLASIQNLNLDSMSEMIMTNDLSILDTTELRNETYTDFFKTINQNMTFQILKTKIDMAEGTAEVTVRLRYVDGTDIYKDTINAFLRKVLAVALKNETVTAQQKEQYLAQLLIKKTSEAELQYSEEEVTYPLNKVDNQWKIASLDSNTLRIMTADFQTVENDINASLEDPDASDELVSAAPAANENDVITLNCENFSISYTSFRIANDIAGNPCLMFYYDYTNKSATNSSPMVDVALFAYQNGETCDAAIPENSDEAVNRYMSEIKAGETVNVCQVFSLQNMSPVTLEASASFNFDQSTSTQFIQVQQ
ncbi:MAG: DUF5067 domain-containing protein [Blautia sp.]|nr:DUF5067 domain-containing protein [Blautia sp.]